MNLKFKDEFIGKWKEYFKNTELPLVFYYSDVPGNDVIKAESTKKWSCIICELARVRKGGSIAFDYDSLGCMGARRYLGYSDSLRPGFEYFLSCGNEKMEGERYKQSPELVLELLSRHRNLPATGKYIVFKRWDKLEYEDQPEVVIFFAKTEVLSGLFTLVNFDQVDPNGVIAPFSSGCGSIIHYPLAEVKSENPRAVIGMFDPSARPCVQTDVLTFAVPYNRFEKMISYMDESFLITDTWKTVMKRL